MEAFSILSMVGAAFACAGAVLSYVRIVQKRQSQRKLAVALQRKAASLISEIKRAHAADEKQHLYERLNQIVQEIVDSLPPSDKSRILEGFNRQSIMEQGEYVENVLSHAK